MLNLRICQMFWNNIQNCIDPEVVGRDWLIPFSLSNFSEHFWTNKFQKFIRFVCLIIHISHLCKLGHRKRVLKNFRKFISQERHTIFLICIAYCLYFTLLFKWQLYLLSKDDFYESRNYKFSRKITKIFIRCLTLRNEAILDYQGCIIRLQIPTT